jgi:hypothetical protein
MADMTEEDARLIAADSDEDAKQLPDRILDAVRALKHFHGPLRVTRFEQRRLRRVLRALRPELLRDGLRLAAARVLRADGAACVL